MITGVILAHNEERHVVECIKALRPHVEEIFLIDTESSDRTAELARPLVDRVLSHPNAPNFDSIRNIAVPEASFGWLWFVDADERIPDATGAIVRRLIRDHGDEFEAINIPFKSHFCGKWMQHCGWWPGYTCPRVLKRGHFEFSRTLHAGVNVQGREIRLPPDSSTAIEHYSFRDLRHYIEKFNRYTSTEALQLAERGVNYDWRGALRFMVHDLWEHYELNNARLDGERGWILTWMAGQYRWLSVTKLIDHGHSPECRGEASSAPADLDEFMAALEEELAAFRATDPKGPFGVVWRGTFWEDTREAFESRFCIASLAGTERPLRVESLSDSQATRASLPESERRLLAALERCRRLRDVVTITQWGKLVVPPDQCACHNVLRVLDEAAATPDLMPVLNAYDEVWTESERQMESLQCLGAAPERLRAVPSLVVDDELSDDVTSRRLEDELRRIERTFASQPLSTPKQSRIHVLLEGEYWAGHSFSNINEQLALRLSGETPLALSLLNTSRRNSAAVRSPTAHRLRAHFGRPLGAAPDVVIRHSFPPNWQRPTHGKWVHIQPWEFGTLPLDWLPHLRDEVDEIWVMSTYVENVYLRSGVSPEKLHYIPWGVDGDAFRPHGPARILPTDKTFLFLYVGGTILRKGFDRVLAAYLDEFGPNDDVCLVIKDLGANSFYAPQCMRAQVLEAMQEPSNPALLYLDEDMTPGQLAALYRACDCLVAPYRGEGFGLPILESLACGVPPIVPTGGPTDDFVDAQSGFLLPTRVVPAEGIPNLNGGTELEVRLDDLRMTMRCACTDRKSVRQRGANGSERVLQQFSWTSTIERIVKRIQAVCDRAPMKSAVSGPLRQVAAIAKPSIRLGALICDIEHPADLSHTLACTRPFVTDLVVIDDGRHPKARQIACEYNAAIAAPSEQVHMDNCDWALCLRAGEYLAEKDLHSLSDCLRELPADIVHAFVACEGLNGCENSARLSRCTSEAISLPGVDRRLREAPNDRSPSIVSVRVMRSSTRASSARRPLAPNLAKNDVRAPHAEKHLADLPEPVRRRGPCGQYGRLCKPVLIQMASGPHVQLLELTRDHHRRYAESHGMDYWCIAGHPVSDKQAGWGKVPLLIAALELGYETAIWLDADAVVVRPEFNLSRLVDRGIGMVRHPHPPHWNTGFIVVNGSTEASQFWKEVNDVPENGSAWMEQEAANSLASEPRYKGLVHLLDLRFNSVPGYAVADEPVVIAAHGLPMELRKSILESALTDLASRPNLEHDVHPPSRREEFGGYLNELGLVGEAVEIGVLRGEHAKVFLTHWRGKILHLVDPWRHLPNYRDISNLSDDEFEECLATTRRNLAPFSNRYRIHRMESAEAVAAFADASIDFVYLDGNHQFDAVAQDLKLWYPKLRPGGIMAGHDFLDGDLAEGSFGVESAVRAFVRGVDSELHATIEPAWPSWHFRKHE